jgi:hypothetical protein
MMLKLCYVCHFCSHPDVVMLTTNSVFVLVKLTNLYSLWLDVLLYFSNKSKFGGSVFWVMLA